MKLSISGLSVTKNVGDTVTVNATVTNNDTVTRTFYIRCSMVKPGETIGFDLLAFGGVSYDYALTLLGPGLSKSVTFMDVIPTGTPAGTYGCSMIARLSEGASGEAVGEYYGWSGNGHPESELVITGEAQVSASISITNVS